MGSNPAKRATFEAKAPLLSAVDHTLVDRRDRIRPYKRKNWHAHVPAWQG